MNLDVKKIQQFIIVVLLALNIQDANAKESSQALTEMQDFTSTAKAIAIDSIMHTHIYNASILKTPRYYELKRQVNLLASQVNDHKKFIEGFSQIWSAGPLSHVRLGEKQQSAEQLAKYLDTMSIADNGTVLSSQNDIAMLTVYPMMGQNTIDQINDAFRTLSVQKP